MLDAHHKSNRFLGALGVDLRRERPSARSRLRRPARVDEIADTMQKRIDGRTENHVQHFGTIGLEWGFCACRRVERGVAVRFASSIRNVQRVLRHAGGSDMPAASIISISRWSNPQYKSALLRRGT